jgi:hypothetical protein
MYFYYSLCLHLFCRDYVVMSTNVQKLPNAQKNKPAVTAAPTKNSSMIDYLIMILLAINIFTIIKTWYSSGFDSARVLIILFVISFVILWLVNLARKYLDKNSGNNILKVLIALIILFQFPLVIFAILSMSYIFIKGVFFS